MVQNVTNSVAVPKKIILKKWRKRIDNAEKRGHFNDTDDDMATDWMKCACGERSILDEEISRIMYGKANDDDLNVDREGNLVRANSPEVYNTVDLDGIMTKRAESLGCKFGSAITSGYYDFDEARAVLHKVENLKHMVKPKYRKKTTGDKRQKEIKEKLKPVKLKVEGYNEIKIRMENSEEIT